MSRESYKVTKTHRMWEKEVEEIVLHRFRNTRVDDYLEPSGRVL